MFYIISRSLCLCTVNHHTSLFVHNMYTVHRIKAQQCLLMKVMSSWGYPATILTSFHWCYYKYISFQFLGNIACQNSTFACYDHIWACYSNEEQRVKVVTAQSYWSASMCSECSFYFDVDSCSTNVSIFNLWRPIDIYMRQKLGHHWFILWFVACSASNHHLN